MFWGNRVTQIKEYSVLLMITKVYVSCNSSKWREVPVKCVGNGWTQRWFQIHWFVSRSVKVFRRKSTVVSVVLKTESFQLKFSSKAAYQLFETISWSWLSIMHKWYPCFVCYCVKLFRRVLTCPNRCASGWIDDNPYSNWCILVYQLLHNQLNQIG